MLLSEITAVVTIDSLFEKMHNEFVRSAAILAEVDINPDGSIPWDAPSDAEKARASNIVQRQHSGPSADQLRQKQLATSIPVPGDFVSIPDQNATGVIVRLDQNTGHVTVVGKDKKQLGTFNIKDMKLDGASTTSYKTVYGMFRDVLQRPIAPPEAMVKRFTVGGGINI